MKLRARRLMCVAISAVALVGGCAGLRRADAPPSPSLAAGATVTPRADPRAYGAYLKAQEALRRNDVAAAIRQLRVVVRRDPGAVLPRLRLAQLLLAVGEDEDAAAQLRDVAIDPEQLPDDLLDTYLRHLAVRGDGAATRRTISVALSRGMLNPIVLLQWVSAEEYRTAPAELLQYVESLRAVNPDYGILDCVAGHLRVRDADYDAALAPLDRCLEQFPEWLPGMLERALVAEIGGDIDLARLLYRRVLAQQPGQALAVWRLRRMEQPEAAGDGAAELKRLLDEVRYETAMQLSADALREGDDLRAETFLKSLPERTQARSRTRLLLGLIYERRNMYDDAEAAYNRALTDPALPVQRVAAMQWVQLRRQVEPDGWEAVVRERYDREPSAALALALGLALAADDLERAATFFHAALPRHPDDVELHYRLGIVYEELKRRDAAMAEMEAVIALDPEHADALNFVGYSLAEVGRDLERAEILIRKAIELKPNAGYIMDSLGWVLYQLGRPAEAAPWLERALESEGDDPVILEHLGDAHAKTGDREAAGQSYRRALEMSEDPDEAARLRQKISEMDRAPRRR